MGTTKEDPLQMRVEHIEGDRFGIDIRGHRVDVDQPVEDGGEDKAPTPTELFVASLASCVAFYARRYLARHGRIEHVVVNVNWELGTRPARVEEINLEVRADAPPEEVERFRRVIEHCTVHNSISAAPRITFHVAPY